MPINMRLFQEVQRRLRRIIELKPKDRVVIVFDGDKWFIRRLCLSEHDMEKDEMVYHCDEPHTNDLENFDEVIDALLELSR